MNVTLTGNMAVSRSLALSNRSSSPIVLMWGRARLLFYSELKDSAAEGAETVGAVEILGAGMPVGVGSAAAPPHAASTANMVINDPSRMNVERFIGPPLTGLTCDLSL